MLRISLLPPALAVALIAGCAPPGPTPTATPLPHPTPVFASNEEALAAAEEAYAAYLRVSDEIGNEGGANPERIAEVVSPESVETEEASFRDLAESGRALLGTTAFTGMTLQSATLEYPVEVAAYTCLDLSGTRLVDKNGADVTPADSPDTVSFVIYFTSDVQQPERLLVVRSDVWSASNLC